MKFLHTSDWQIGMKAESVGRMAERVREERLEAAKRVVQAARDNGAEMIVLTGDVFEDNAVDRLLVRKIGEILRAFPGPVYIIPGNHDPLIPGSVWEHSVWKDAANINVFSKSEPVELAGCILFPCPLHGKYSTKNPTSWINAKDATKPAIGLAHGNVEGIPNGEPDYPIPRDAANRLGLDYLALGHWHSFARYDTDDGLCRMAYAGTHETTKFGERDSGNAVFVEIAQRGSPPKLTRIKTGRLDWRSTQAPSSRPRMAKVGLSRWRPVLFARPPSNCVPRRRNQPTLNNVPSPRRLFSSFLNSTKGAAHDSSQPERGQLAEFAHFSRIGTSQRSTQCHPCAQRHRQVLPV
jgi:DNA repair exonuclease SbcCD nuclease subunit